MTEIYDTDTINGIKDILLQRHETIAVAESVTAGHVQAAFSLADDAALFFQGGITAYNLGQKCRHLHVEPVHAENCNCVSEKVAQEMVVHVARLFSSDWGIAVTGYASPIPGVPADKLHAHYCISYREQPVQHGTLTVAGKQKPLVIQLAYTERILASLFKLLRQRRKSY